MDDEVDQGQLSLVDLLCLFGLLMATSALGLALTYCRKPGGRSTTAMSDFALAGGNMGIVPVAFSIAATVMAGSTMVGATGEVYLYAGTEYLMFGVGACLGLVISGLLVVPVYRNIKYVSVYEYLERRYDRAVRIFFSAVYILAKTVFISVTLYVPALSLSTLTSTPQWASVVISGVICIAYCVVGGMKAVIWTDVLQAVFMVTCNLLLLGFGLSRVGVRAAWDLMLSGGRLGHLTLVEDQATRYSVWSLTLGTTVIFMNAMCAGQAGIQRILTVKGLKQALRATYLSAGMVLFFVCLTVSVGLVLYAVYAGCDPILRSSVTGVRTHDQVMVYAIGDLLGGVAGLRGLALAGIFSGSLSTFSSYINSFATLTVEDFIPHHRLVGREDTKLKLCRLFTLVYGLVAMVVAFLVPYLGGIIQTSSLITGCTGGPLTGVILLGMLSRRTTKRGVLLGLVVGLSFTAWIAAGNRFQASRGTAVRHLPQSVLDCPRDLSPLSLYANVSDALVYNATAYHAASPNDQNTTREGPGIFNGLYSVSFMWYGPIGLFLTIAVGFVFSLVLGGSKENLDDRLFYSGTKKGPVPTAEDEMMLGSLSNGSPVVILPEGKALAV